MKRVAFAPLALVTFLALGALGGCVGYNKPSDPKVRPLPIQDLKLPAGFHVGVFSDDVPGARSLALGEKGTVFVGTRDEGKVYALRDDNGDGKADRVRVIANGLDTPNGVAVRDGSLYVAEIARILRFDAIEDHLDGPPPPVVVYDRFPPNPHHGWKFIAFGPDGWLYVPVGAPCNNCESADIFAAIHRIRPDGSAFETWARGIRNTVGFDWNPATKELWFTDNGRDMLSDDEPPDELNCAPTPGLHFGYPYCHGMGISDPEFGSKRPCSDFTKPEAELGAHVAALGMRFYTGRMFPKKFQNAIFIAEHGSWNRTHPAGYRVVVARLTEDGRHVASTDTFIEGWLSPDGRKAWGRPVDVLVMPGGALLVSDDRAGAVYRITWVWR